MKKYIIIIAIATLIYSNLFAQNITISGFITDKETGETLINATLFSDNSGTATNEYGFYSYTAAQGVHRITISYIGYQPSILSIVLRRDTTVNIQLVSNLNISEVIISDKQNKFTQNNLDNRFELSPSEIAKLPLMLGEPDVIKAVQLLPGVQACNEANGGLMVRGGSTDGNLILLDDIPIFNVSHLWGLFSVFDPNVIKSIQFYNGNFPSKFGGRTSSVLNLRLKDGNKYEYHGDVSIGAVSSKLLLEGPIIKEKISFLFSARRTYLDLPLTLIQKFQHPDFESYKKGYYFYDLIGKISWNFSPKDKLFFSVYNGLDNTYIEEQRDTTLTNNSNLNWGNSTYAIRWNHQWSPKVFSNLTSTKTTYTYGVSQEKLSSDSLSYSLSNYDYASSIKNYSLKLDAKYYINNQTQIEFGGFFTKNIFDTGNSTNYTQQTRNIDDATENIYTTTPYNTIEYGAYISSNFKLFDLVYPTIGLRYSSNSIDNITYNYFEPRVSLLATKDGFPVSFNIGYSKMHQPLFLLANYGINLPIDLWVPATKTFKPKESEQFNISINYNRNSYKISISAYYKNLYNLIDYKVGEGFSSINLDWENKITSGSGKSKGIELLIEKSSNKFYGNIAYTLSKTERQFEEINNGNWFPSTYDHRHEIKTNCNYQIRKNIDLNVVWIFGTGGAVTVPESKYYLYDGTLSDYSDEPYLIYSSRNNYRMPAYHRLDIGANISKELKRGTRIISFGVYNLYNRKNPYYLTYDSNQTPAKFNTNSLLSFLPYLSYRFKF